MNVIATLQDTSFWYYVGKYFVISVCVTSTVLVLVFQIPMARRRVLNALDRLADWHSKGTMEAEADVQDRSEKKETRR